MTDDICHLHVLRFPIFKILLTANALRYSGKSLQMAHAIAPHAPSGPVHAPNVPDAGVHHMAMGDGHVNAVQHDMTQASGSSLGGFSGGAASPFASSACVLNPCSPFGAPAFAAPGFAM
jgi:hypothetical protein